MTAVLGERPFNPSPLEVGLEALLPDKLVASHKRAEVVTSLTRILNARSDV